MSLMQGNRDAVIAIQGGGVYGLTLLGQLQAVIEDHEYVPLAFAGTSAGAIVATLAWAGFGPREIRDEFRQMANSVNGPLVPLLGPIAPDGLDLDALEEVWKESQRLGTRVFEGNSWQKFCAGLEVAKLVRKLYPHFLSRGVFPGTVLEEKLDELLKKKIRVPGITSREPLRFRHVHELMMAGQARNYHPPLMLTATNLTKRRLEIINSYDPNYFNVPIAKAVRASAGIPVFFTPQELQECPDGGWFVDGGVIANFPIWAFSDVFRAQIINSPARDLYGHIASRPWIRIGLRTVEDLPTPPDLRDSNLFFKSIGMMFVGDSRNQLEEVLASTAPRALIVRQPYAETNGPTNFLDFKNIDADKVDSMVARGREFADKALVDMGSPGVISSDPHLGDSVVAHLKKIVERCALVFQGNPAEGAFRANVFMPVVSSRGPVNRLIYSFNMDRDGDREMEFPDLQSGATGFCFSTRSPVICNLRTVSELRASNEENYSLLFGMDPKLQGQVRKDRSWLVSVPIFDPYEVRHNARGAAKKGESDYKGYAYQHIETEIDGPLVGVLNIDVALDYDKIGMNPDPNFHFSDKRVQAILAIMQAASFRLGAQISEDFPRKVSTEV